MSWLITIAVLLACGCHTDTTLGSNFQPRADARGLPQCADAKDNDGDGATDYPFEPGCDDPSDDSETDPPIPRACSDNVDNDADTVTDFPVEPGCSSAADNDETDPFPLPQCSDGEDNDGDGDIDYPDDQSCESAAGSEATETS